MRSQHNELLWEISDLEDEIEELIFRLHEGENVQKELKEKEKKLKKLNKSLKKIKEK